MKKSVLILFTAAVMLALSGCCTANCHMNPAPAGTPAPEGYNAVATGTATTDGLYLFNKWILVAGNTNRPNTNDYAAWDDNVTEQRNADMMLRNMKKAYGAERLYGIKSDITSTGWYTLWLVSHRRLTLTATGIRKK